MLSDIPSLMTDHYKMGNINWPMGVYISLVHIVAVFGFFAAFQSDAKTLLWAFLLWPARYVGRSTLDDRGSKGYAVGDRPFLCITT
jgi:uncharacterized membrane protein YfcA